VSDRDDIGRKTVDRLRNFSERLAASGGDIDKTGLPVTRYEQCDCRIFNFDGMPIPGCCQCQGSGQRRVRTINGEPTE
jgi:hypothetical protein